MPSNIWLRLEPNSISENLSAGLQAAVHDPLWMLARQWQTGEYQGEDAGSPVHVQLQMSCTPLTRYSNGAIMGALPLETLIEREEVRVSEKFQPRLAAEAGLQFLRLLEAHGDSGTLRNGVLKEFPLQVPDKELLKKLDHNTSNFLRVMANRVPDGHLLYAARNTSEIWQKWSQSFNKSELKTLEETADVWKEWYETLLFSEPAPKESAWLPNRLEYSITVAAPIREEEVVREVVLTAPEYTGGHLDWYSFNIQQTGSLGAKDDLTLEEIKAKEIPYSAIPMPINYRGMPVSRYWEFEDARVDFGAMAAGKQQLAKLILIDFALIAGDDWFIIPVMVPVGTLCNTSLLKVQDTFGKITDVSSAYDLDMKKMRDQGLQDEDLPWNLFRLSLDPRSTNQQAQSVPPFNLFLPPTLGTSLNGPTLEEVLFLRDEMANMAWAVERMVEGPLGQAFSRTEAYFRSRESKSPSSGLTGSAGENTQHLVYRLESEVPDHWISLQPVGIGSAAIGFEPHGNWKGHILSRDKDDKPIHEEEVPREGAYVTRAFQYARWINGETYLWIGRRKGVGRGEGSSGLQFDRLEPPTK
ncbi:MAG: hypothetical protein Q8L02_00815 [Candidatus Nitrotoga sp.]|nr:hypothetical protein [Candidatus Nitrotoga sp.]